MSGWSGKANALRGAKYLHIGGKVLGVGGAGLSVYEDFSKGELGIGTGVKVAIGLATTFFGGPFVLSYVLLDLAVGVATGTTLTDRIAAGVENQFKD